MERKLRDYWVKKLLFSEVFSIDTPGIIISETSRFFGSHKVKKRDVYHFERIFRELQVKTIEKLGADEASKFYYKMGKDLGTGYLLLSGVEKVPAFLVPIVMKALCKITWASGISVSEHISVLGGGKYILEGSNNMFCRNTGNGAFFAGVYSGMVSCLSGKNVEGVPGCRNCPEGCKITLDPSIDMIYIPDIESLRLNKKRSSVELPESVPKTSRTSFSDLMKFGKVDFSDNGVCFKGETIFSTEQEMFDLVARYYSDYGLKDFFEETVMESSCKLAKDIFKENGVKNNFEEMLNILCAFGWGIPEYSKSDDEISLSFICAPISSNVPFYSCFIINGFLNAILGVEYRVKDIRIDSSLSEITVVYSKV